MEEREFDLLRREAALLLVPYDTPSFLVSLPTARISSFGGSWQGDYSVAAARGRREVPIQDLGQDPTVSLRDEFFSAWRRISLVTDPIAITQTGKTNDWGSP
jgi:hypothetical protein